MRASWCLIGPEAEVPRQPIKDWLLGRLSTFQNGIDGRQSRLAVRIRSLPTLTSLELQPEKPAKQQP
jgi:hypothetical protein